MRCLINALCLDITDTNDADPKTILVGLLDQLGVEGVPALAPVWAYFEFELDPDDEGELIEFALEHIDPDGATTVVQHVVARAPERRDPAVPAMWGTRWQITLDIHVLGPHEVRLRVDGDVIATRYVGAYIPGAD